MSRIDEQIAARKPEDGPFIAFEYYPPRTEDGVKNLYSRIGRMAAQKPLYADVTWGAGGSTSDLTLELCIEAQRRFDLNTNMHLTCTNMEEKKLTKALEGAKEAGIKNILALRGDPPAGQQEWTAVDGGLTCALDLVRYIRDKYGDEFCISVAGYPEGHPNVIHKLEGDRELTEGERGRLVEHDGEQFVCSDADYEKELDYLQKKIEAGASMIVTQMFFDVDVFIQFVQDCRARGITVPILPGIMCIQNYRGFSRMTRFCKTRVPKSIVDRVEAAKDDDTAVKRVGVEVGVDMCKAILDAGVSPGLHFYTLNLEKVVISILHGLDLAEDVEQSPTVEEPASMMKGTILSASYDEVGRERQLQQLEQQQMQQQQQQQQQ